jgi:isopentenyl-diphosphate Delta-isomerase
MTEPNVILVNKNDVEMGISGKMEAHYKGLLHRAVSVFIINSSGQWILQRRALNKYHSKGLWTNTCCSHPYPGETNIEAAGRRLKEEMGMQCKLKEIFSFTYKEKLDNELTEHEFDHVFIGISDDDPMINANEVHEWKKFSFNTLHEDILKNPNNYTFWFKEIYKRVHDRMTNDK